MKKLLPKYSWLPIIFVIVLNCIAFFGTRLFNSGWAHYDMTLPIDDRIPFCAPMISVYVLAFVTWAVGLVLIGRESREICYEVLSGEMTAKLITMGIFLLIPTTMERAQVTGDDLWSQLTRLIYSADSPDNLFPSVHCLENWVIFRGFMRCKRLHKGWVWGALVAALLVFASVVMVKQHVFVDIIGAVVVGEIGLWLGRRLKAGRVLERINVRLGFNGE